MKEIIIGVFLLIIGIVFSFFGDLEEGVKLICSAIILYLIVKFINSMTDEPKENRAKIINSFHVHKEKDNILDEMKKANNNMDEQHLLNFAKSIFVKYHTSIKEKNLELLKTISTPEFISRQEKIISDKDVLKDNSDFIEIEKIYFSSNAKSSEKENITVGIKYTETKNEYNVATGEKIVGLTKKINKTVYVTFKRVEDEIKKDIYTTNCPMCGAPTEVVTAGKCQYCGELIQIENLVWKINDVRYV